MRATITTDLSFGDAGKGTTVEYLVSQSDSAAVIRFNGGGQAEHNIVTPDGRHHVFSQFGAASFLPDIPTHLSYDVLVNPFNMYPEAEHLIEQGVTDIWDRVTVDAYARIVTPYHRAGNCLRELVRGSRRHGSTGQGISEAVLDWMTRPELTIYAGDLQSRTLIDRLESHRLFKRDQMAAMNAPKDTPDWEALNNTLLSKLYAEEYFDWTQKVRVVEPGYLAVLARQYEHLVFEAAQGVLLDEKRGFHPHTTWSNTTPDNARRQLLDIGFTGAIKTLGILRAYTTRHGPGPFVTEAPELDGPLYEYFNGTGPWQGHFRIGYFDAVAHRYALNAIGGVDELVVTGLDRMEQFGTWRYATEYQLSSESDASTYFVQNDDGVATDIKVGRYGDKLYIARLAELLFAAAPIYTEVNNRSSDDIVKTIERELGTPVTLTSYGPTVADKIVRC